VFVFEFVFGRRLAASGARCVKTRDPSPAVRTRTALHEHELEHGLEHAHAFRGPTWSSTGF
jgi:hypothetical protein